MTPTPQLTPLQLSILRVLWKRGEARVVEVREALAGEKDLAQNTIATVLSRLEKAGLVCHRCEGRVFIYRALISEREANDSMVGELTKRVFDGDLSKLFAHMIGRGDVSPRDLERVKSMIVEREERQEG